MRNKLIKSNMGRGIVFILLSVIFFTLMNVMFKLAGSVPAVHKTVYRSVTMSIIMYILMRKNGDSLKDVKRWKLLLVRSFIGTTGLLLNIWVLDKLVLSDIGVISRLSTVFVVIFSAVFLGEKLKRIQILSVLVAFAGVILVIKPSFSSEMIPYLVAIFSSMLAATAYTMVRELGKTEKASIIVFVFSTFALVTLSPFMFIDFMIPTPRQIFFLISAGLCAALAQITITNAYKNAPAREISIFEYFGVLLSGVLGYFIFGETVDIISIIGYIVIFLSAYIVYRYNKSHQ